MMEDNVDDEIEKIRQKKMQEMMNKAFEIKVPEDVIHIGSPEQFNELVNGYRKNLFVIDLYADWCGPCKAFAPIFEATQKQFIDKGVIFMKINVDYNREIAQQFQVMGVPTTVYIHDKKIIHKQSGMLPKGAFTSLINRLLEKVKDR